MEYPLCPEVMVSAAVDAVLASYQHLLEDLGVSPKRVVFVGDSGGGQVRVCAVCVELPPSPPPLWVFI